MASSHRGTAAVIINLERRAGDICSGDENRDSLQGDPSARGLGYVDSGPSQDDL